VKFTDIEPGDSNLWTSSFRCMLLHLQNPQHELHCNKGLWCLYFQNVCILIGTSKLGANISRWLSKSFYKIQPWGMGPPTNSNPTRAMYATTEVSHIVISTTIVSWFALDIETMKHVSTWRICFEHLHGFASTDILVWETEPYYGFSHLDLVKLC